MIYQTERDRENEEIVGFLLAERFDARVTFTPTLHPYDFKLERADGQVALYESKRRSKVANIYKTLLLDEEKVANLQPLHLTGAKIYLCYWLSDGLWRARFDPPYPVKMKARRDRANSEASVCLIDRGDFTLIATAEDMMRAEEAYRARAA